MKLRALALSADAQSIGPAIGIPLHWSLGSLPSGRGLGPKSNPSTN